MQSHLVPELLFGGGNLLSIKCKWHCQLAYLEEHDLCPFKRESLCLSDLMPAQVLICQFPNVAQSRAALLNWDLQKGIQRGY